MLTVKTLQSLRTEENFELFWKKINIKCQELEVSEPQLDRKRKIPKRFDHGSAQAEYPVSAKSEYRRIFFESLDLAVNCIQQRFDQKGFKFFSLLFKACTGKSHSEELDKVCECFNDDFNIKNLISKLTTLRELFQSTSAGITPSVNSIKSSLLSITSAQRVLLSEVSKLLKLLLVLPATHATSERSFSALRRVKSYLRNTMSQSRLNHLMILHYHQQLIN